MCLGQLRGMWHELVHPGARLALLRRDLPDGLQQLTLHHPPIMDDVLWIHLAALVEHELPECTNGRPTVTAERVIALPTFCFNLWCDRVPLALPQNGAQSNATKQHPTYTILVGLGILIGLARTLRQVDSLSIECTSVGASKVHSELLVSDILRRGYAGSVEKPLFVGLLIQNAQARRTLTGGTHRGSQHLRHERRRGGTLHA
mmetsp:Transcript_106084/g.306872  ORF Transcript_106084/g.306872 Transcript_106084/m.306872 type:complete len:203 (-) Transcript_106084:1025-1633(-)